MKNGQDTTVKVAGIDDLSFNASYAQMCKSHSPSQRLPLPSTPNVNDRKEGNVCLFSGCSKRPKKVK